MWVVLDSNQAQPAILRQLLGRSDRIEGLTVPPLVLCELLLKDDADSVRRVLGDCGESRLRIGRELSPLLHDLARLAGDAIITHRPFEQLPLSEILQDRDRVVRADRIKSNNRNFIVGLADSAERVRVALEATEATRGIGFASFAEARAILAAGSDSFLGNLVVDSIRRGRTPVVNDPGELHAAAMSNPFLASYFNAVLAYLVVVSNLLDQRQHRGRSIGYLPGGRDRKGDDWTDLSTFLYGSEDDWLLSEDRRLIDLRMIVRSPGEACAGTWEDLAGTRRSGASR